MSDIIGIVDDNGNLITSYAYDAWGKVLSVTGSNVELGNLNPFRYRSYYYDSDIEMYYLQSRYYDPEVCRFINSDDVNYIGSTGTINSYNAFAYCENEPVNSYDCNGLKAKKIKSLFNYTALISKKLNSMIKIKTVKGTKKTKGHIIVDFTVVNSDNLAYALNYFGLFFINDLTDIAFSKFKKKMKRAFLFDKECVSDEILAHLKGYLWCVGKIKSFPLRFYGYYYIDSEKKREDN